MAFNDEESIFGHLDSFCSRIRQVIDAVYTLVQYGKLAKNAEGLPRPRKEDLLLEDDASDELMELAGPGGSVASDSLGELVESFNSYHATGLIPIVPSPKSPCARLFWR